MGNSNNKESLFEAVNSDDCAKVEQILKINPSWINESMMTEDGSTPLQLAAWRGNLEMIYTLLNLGAEINSVGVQKLSPLQWTARRGKDEALDFLIQKGADINFISQDNMNALDYAMIYGNYNVARKLINLGLRLKTPEEYNNLKKGKNPIYYDFALMIDCIDKNIPLEECPPFNQPPPEKQFFDPVIDPRETWPQFFKRVMEFDDPPLVERSELPPELQPQNRFFGKVRSFLNGQPIYGPEDQASDHQNEGEETHRLEEGKEIELENKSKVKNVYEIKEKISTQNSKTQDTNKENEVSIKSIEAEKIEITSQK